ncbi:MAG: FmdB family transcriptional regulator [Acidobacteriota bacterium]
MPIYEYACEACGRVTEVIQRFEDPPLTVCPECGGAVKKMLSAPAFQFKGEGWYVTDYARKGGGKGEGAKGAGATGESAKGDATKSESSSTGESSAAGTKSERPTGGGTAPISPAKKE